MSVFGIVCETNPIHNGHKHLIDMAIEKGASAVVCVMSGNTVQRGEFAIADKYVRAEALLKCGADLVLELPFPWSAASAEYFASAAISVLRDFCDNVIFGSECGDINILSRAAEFAADPSFKEKYNLLLLAGEPAAGAYFDMLEKVSGAKLNSNDLLGVEYIKAARTLSADIEFSTIKRLGDNYTSTEVSDSVYPSAMSIRKLWQENKTENMEEYMPYDAIDVYKNAIYNNCIISASRLDTALLTFFRTHNGADLEGIAGASGGLGNRICEMAHRARSAEELLTLVKTKRYTDANIKRTILYCMSGVKKWHIEALPEETLLLSVNKKGRALLSKKRKSGGIKVVTKPADRDASLPQNILSDRIDAVYTLLREDILPSDIYKTKGPYIT